MHLLVSSQILASAWTLCLNPWITAHVTFVHKRLCNWSCFSISFPKLFLSRMDINKAVETYVIKMVSEPVGVKALLLDSYTVS